MDLKIIPSPDTWPEKNSGNFSNSMKQLWINSPGKIDQKNLRWRRRYFRRIKNESYNSKLKLCSLEIINTIRVLESEMIGRQVTVAPATLSGEGRVREVWVKWWESEWACPSDQRINSALSGGHVERRGPLLVDKCEFARASLRPSDVVSAEPSKPLIWHLARARSDVEFIRSICHSHHF